MMRDMMGEQLKILQEQGLKRQLRMRQGPMGRQINVRGRDVLNFCSNDYLGLANDPRLNEAAMHAVSFWGAGSGASRLVAGDMAVIEELEEEIAALKGCEEAIIFNSGFAANTGIIPALAGRDDIVFSDKLNHASIVDGIILSRAEHRRYAHNDMGALQDGLAKSAHYRRRVIVTDAVFSMDGDVAPLQKIVELAKRHDAWVIVDEAHAFGLLGDQGGGLAQSLGLTKDIDVNMGTLSKAAGSFGAYAAGKKPIKDYMCNCARSLIYTTALPASVYAASLAAVRLIASPRGQALREKVMRDAAMVREGLRAMGLDTLSSETAIIPVVLKDSVKALEAALMLWEKGLYVAAIRPPTVPVGSARLRLSITASHTPDDLAVLLQAMKEVSRAVL